MGQEREESQGFYEMLWDCEFCGAQGLLAKSQRHCASCGAPQNPDKRYFPKEGEQKRIDGYIYEGADRTCPACKAPQSAKAKNCTHCGSILDGAGEVRGIAAPPGFGGAPMPGMQPNMPPPGFGAPGMQPPGLARRPAARRPWLWPVIAVGAILFGGLFWWRCLHTEQAQVEVAGHHWQRTISIEEFNERTEEGWRDQIPVNAGFPSCIDKQRDTRKVEDGEECHTEKRDKKDGTFEQVKKCSPKYRSEPVMGSWCHFTVRRWRPSTDVRATGNNLSPEWPTNVPSTANAMAVLGARRQGARIEKLTLDFTGHGSCDVSDAIWRKYTDGQKLIAEIHSGGDVACGSL